MILSKETALFQKDAIASLASSSKYITKINDSGIKIHPYDDSLDAADANHFLSLTAEGIQIYSGGAESNYIIAKFNTVNNNPEITVGYTGTNQYNTYIDNQGLYLRTGTTSYATLNVSGLTLSKGGLKSGTIDTNNFVYLSSEPLTDTVFGYEPGQIALDNYTNSDWRQLIGTKFGVRADGTLYASNAHVEGQITANSLTVGVGDNAYNGIVAINSLGYYIQVVEDIDKAPETDTNDNSVIINPVQNTYLYPVLYYRGARINEYTRFDTKEDTNPAEEGLYECIEEDSEGNVDVPLEERHYELTSDTTVIRANYYYKSLILDHFKWYKGDSEEALSADTIHGGIIADREAIYQVRYLLGDENDSVVQQFYTVTAYSKKYITEIDDGITIRPADNLQNGINITDHMEVVANGTTVASYGTETVIGAENGFHITLSANETGGRLSFFQGQNNEVAYITNDKLYITQSVVLQQMDLGETEQLEGQGQWSWLVHLNDQSKNNLCLKWRG